MRKQEGKKGLAAKFDIGKQAEQNRTNDWSQLSNIGKEKIKKMLRINTVNPSQKDLEFGGQWNLGNTLDVNGGSLALKLACEIISNLMEKSKCDS